MTTTTPQPPLTESAGDDPEVVVEEKLLSKNNPVAPQEPAEVASAPDPAPALPAPPPVPEGGAEPPLRADAHRWVHQTLTERTPHAAMLTREQAHQLVENVLALLHAGWTTTLITRQLGRLNDLKYRYTPVRDKLDALGDLDPADFVAPAPKRASTPAPQEEPVTGPILSKAAAMREIATLLASSKSPRKENVSP